jgi:hypothetical protein
LFKAKRRPTLNRVWVAAEIGKPNFTFFDFPLTGQMSELIGEEEVRILDSDKKIFASRSQPRKAFRGLRRQLYWDVLDFVYFGGYATWNYLVTPFFFLRKDFQIEELAPLTTSHGTYLRLQVQFPAALPTHCKSQVFYFDENYLSVVWTTRLRWSVDGRTLHIPVKNTKHSMDLTSQPRGGFGRLFLDICLYRALSWSP